jgi:hypothetical protein
LRSGPLNYVAEQVGLELSYCALKLVVLLEEGRPSGRHLVAQEPLWPPPVPLIAVGCGVMQLLSLVGMRRALTRLPGRVVPLLSRRGRSSPANASGFDSHRASITSRFDWTRRAGSAAADLQSLRRTLLGLIDDETAGEEEHAAAARRVHSWMRQLEDSRGQGRMESADEGTGAGPTPSQRDDADDAGSSAGLAQLAPKTPRSTDSAGSAKERLGLEPAVLGWLLKQLPDGAEQEPVR